MRKIRLDLEDLCVDSFVTDAADGRRGTVNGNAKAQPTAEEGCQPAETTPISCGTGCLECETDIHYSCIHSCNLVQTCAQASACTLCPGGVTWFCD